MSKRSRIYDEQKAEADMTPMLDIVFILLIFFIVTTSFVKEKGFLINKPDAGKSNLSNTPILLIRINENSDCNENLWTSMNFNENKRKSMKINEN